MAVFKKNIGETDKNIRLAVGAIFMGVALKTTGITKALTSIFGIYFTLSSLTGFCLLYYTLSINTND